MNKKIYATPVYRYKNNELCSVFEEAKDGECFVRLEDFHKMEQRLKKQIQELSGKDN